MVTCPVCFTDFKDWIDFNIHRAATGHAQVPALKR